MVFQIHATYFRKGKMYVLLAQLARYILTHVCEHLRGKAWDINIQEKSNSKFVFDVTECYIDI